MGSKMTRAFTSAACRRDRAPDFLTRIWPDRRRRSCGVAEKINRLRAPSARREVHGAPVMSIDKEGSGLPSVDPHRRTTKVNLSVVLAVVLFFAAMLIVAWWVSTQR